MEQNWRHPAGVSLTWDEALTFINGDSWMIRGCGRLIIVQERLTGPF